MTCKLLPALILFVGLMSLSACAYHKYDSNNPDDYVDFWCNPDNYRNSLQDGIIDTYKTGSDKYSDECYWRRN